MNRIIVFLAFIFSLLLTGVVSAQTFQDVAAEYKFGSKVFFVDSTGTFPGAPRLYTTIASAVAAASDDRGDIIYVLPDHVENVTSTGLDFNIDGLSVIGLKIGEKRPKISVGDEATATVTVSAENVTLRGINFQCAVDSVNVMLTVSNDGLLVEDCVFDNANQSIEYDIAIQTTDLSSTDLASSTPWTTVTSATGGFTADMVGRSLEITNAGTNFTTGRYTITARNSATSLTVDRAAGSSGAASSGQFSISKANDVTIRNCVFNNTAASYSATECIELAGMTERWTIADNYIVGDFSVSAISAITLKSYDLVLMGNTITNLGTDNVAGGIDLIAATTGSAQGNHVVHLNTTANVGMDLGGLSVFDENLISTNGAHRGVEFAPVADDT